MKLEKDELKVFYASEEINTGLDESLEALLAPFGYRRWASGYNLEEKIRDLAFSQSK